MARQWAWRTKEGLVFVVVAGDGLVPLEEKAFLEARIGVVERPILLD